VSKFDKESIQEPIVFADDYAPAELREANEDDEYDEDDTIKFAIKKWKVNNPNDTIKNQRYRLMRGEITELPWMRLVADNALGAGTHTGFGTSFPDSPNRGDTFVRIDTMPSGLYKYTGSDWIAVDKNLSDSYTYDSAYIDHLINKISTGEYDVDLLSDAEHQQVEQHLQNKAS
jgi:hypothetical protein